VKRGKRKEGKKERGGKGEGGWAGEKSLPIFHEKEEKRNPRKRERKDVGELAKYM